MRLKLINWLKTIFESSDSRDLREFYQYVAERKDDIDRITGALGVKLRKKNGGFYLIENYTGEYGFGYTRKDALDDFLRSYDVSGKHNLEKIQENLEKTVDNP